MKKVEKLLEQNITPVLCIANLVQFDSFLTKAEVIKNQAEKIVFVYEPPNAISGGGDYRPETPERVDEKCWSIKEKIGKEILTIYGGSVNPENIKEFLSQPNIHGALPGQASLDPETFVRLVSAAGEAVV